MAMSGRRVAGQESGWYELITLVIACLLFKRNCLNMLNPYPLDMMIIDFKDSQANNITLNGLLSFWDIAKPLIHQATDGGVVAPLLAVGSLRADH